MKWAEMYSSLLLAPRTIATSIRATLEGIVPSSRIPSQLALSNLPIVSVILDETGKLHRLATMFLLEVAMGSGSVTGDTIRTYSAALVHWLNYLSTRKIRLELATAQDLQLFRNYVWSPPSSGDAQRPGRAKSTVNSRVGTARRFHEWGERETRFSSPLGIFCLGKKGQQYGLPNARLQAKQRFTRPAEQRIPRILSGPELKEIVHRAPLPYSLIFRWAVTTGLRRFELVSMKLSILDNLINEFQNEKSVVTISIARKGGKFLRVYVPLRLINDTKWYVQTERKAKNDVSDLLFLTQHGGALHRENVSRMFRFYADQVRSSATFHHLRHTYAVTVLEILKRQASLGNSINPLKTLQIMMGHASIESTEIYLRAIDVYSDDVAEALDFLYGAAL